MIPVAIEGRANVKLAGRSEDGLESAVERGREAHGPGGVPVSFRWPQCGDIPS